MTQTNQNNLTANAVAVESAIGNRQSAIGNRQSAIGNRQSAIGNRQSAIGNTPPVPDFLRRPAHIRCRNFPFRHSRTSGRESSGRFFRNLLPHKWNPRALHLQTKLGNRQKMPQISSAHLESAIYFAGQSVLCYSQSRNRARGQRKNCYFAALDMLS